MGAEIELVPAHVGDFQAEFFINVKANALAGEQAKAFVDAIFVADVEEHLETEADAKEGFAFFDVGKDWLIKCFAAQSGDGVLECADAGEDDFVGGFDLVGLGDDVGVEANLLEGFLHRAEIGHAIIEDRDGHHGRS